MFCLVSILHGIMSDVTLLMLITTNQLVHSPFFNVLSCTVKADLFYFICLYLWDLHCRHDGFIIECPSSLVLIRKDL